MRARFSRIAIVLFGVLAGCRSELVQGVDEREANAIVLALDEAGVGAWKERSAGAYRIEVSDSEVPRALHVLETRGLPHQTQASLESTFGEGSLIATPDEERARLMSALSGELSRTLEGMPGVIEARVHIALPHGPHRSTRLSKRPPHPSSSVCALAQRLTKRQQGSLSRTPWRAWS